MFVATRGDDTEQATPKPPTTTQPQNTEGISATYAAAPMRNAITKGGDVAVYTSPDANAQPTTTLSAQTEYTLPRSFLVFDQYQDWLHVYLPVRPNDATGWIKASDVTISQPLDYQIKVSLADKKLWLLKDGVVQFEEPAAIGTDENPTPTGTFYYTDPLDLATQPGTALRRVRHRAVGPQQHPQRVRRGRRPDRGPRHQRPGHHRHAGVARVRAGEQRRDHEAVDAAARHARRHHLTTSRRSGVLVQAIVSVAVAVASTAPSAPRAVIV